jgi:hypothetical protein
MPYGGGLQERRVGVWAEKRNEMETKQLGIENTWPGLRASGPGGTITTWLQAHDTSERHSKPTNVEMHMTHMCDNCISGK